MNAEHLKPYIGDQDQENYAVSDEYAHQFGEVLVFRLINGLPLTSIR